MEKDNDMLLNMLANPDFGVSDFQSVGLKAENTQLLSEDEYKRSEKITKNENFLDKDGNFDDSKFHQFYIGAGYFYNKLAQDDYNKTILEQARFSKDNIWVSPEKRTVDFAPKLARMQNEHLITTGLEGVNKKGKQKYSDDEIAQTQKVYNVETGEWTDSPNDSFFSNFLHPLVRATYDEDEYDENGNLIHQKGEDKLNEEGLPYYETLGGRNISGKKVLNKMNILTTDGSFANKFDFFDSDDMEQKSVLGNTLKNAALVGSMFIPYVGPVIAGLSVGSQVVGLLGTFGKMASNLTGVDDSWANELEGWAKSVNRSAQTQYAVENTWCWENLINLAGDGIAQLAEQRWIFKAAPALLAGPKNGIKMYKAMSTEGRNALIKETSEALGKENAEYLSAKKLFDQMEAGSIGKKQLGNYLNTVDYMNDSKAVHIIDELASKANKIGAPISKAYMLGITVGDTYQEAKDNGATDLEAALLTLGYAIGEKKLLDSNLGEWILPELKNNKLKNQAIAEALTKDVREAQKQYMEDKSKKGFVKKLTDIGRKIAGDDIAKRALGASSTAKLASGVVTSHALGEAFEEVSEEALADASKALFNVSRWLRGEDGVDWHLGEGAFDRYAQSALGGFIGGGFNSIGTDFVQAKSLAKMDKTKAMQELLYMVNNGQEGDFLKSLDKMELGNKHLSAKTLLDKNDETGQAVYAEGTKNDNQDKELKDVLRGQVQLLKNILDSEGARISTQSLINTLTFEDQKHLMKDMRFNMLQNAASLGLYLQDYQNIQNDIVRVKTELNSLEAKYADGSKESPQDASTRSELVKELGQLRIKKDAYLSGQMTPQFIRDAIYEMNPVLHNFALHGNLKSFAKFKTGKEFDELSESAQNKVKEDFETYKNTEFKDDVHAQAQMFDDMIANASPVVEQFKLRMQQHAQEAAQMAQLHQTIQKLLQRSENITETMEPDDALDQLGLLLNADSNFNTPFKETNIFESTLKLDATSQAALNAKKLEVPTTPQEMARNHREQFDIIRLGLINNLEANFKPIIDQGYLHPEAKRMIIKTLQDLQHYAINPDNTRRAPKSNLAEERTLKAKAVEIGQYISQIESLNNTPILEFISQYQSAATNSKVNIMDHWKNTMDSFQNAQEDIGDLGVDDDWEANNEEVNKVIESFAAVVSGMRTDNADFGNVTSYSKIMNDVSRRGGTPNPVQYAEIEEDLAGQILQDISLLKKRFDIADTISNLNKGQKLKQQVKVGTNTNHLLYKSLKRLVDILPDDDDDDEIKGGATLKNVIKTADNLARHAETDNINLSREVRNAQAEEITLVENALYDFFQANKDWSTEQLGNFISKFAGPAGFFNKTGGLLTEKTKAMDDNAFIWWMASRAALRSIDFQNAYSQALSDDIASIPSQELATYLGVASLTNMNTLNKFIDAYQHTVVRDFKALSEEDRQKYLDNYAGNHGSNHDAMATKLLDYFAGHNSVPQFHNMIFIEGAPGTGKSKGVYRMVINTAKQIDPSILDNAMYVHATQKSADSAAADLELSQAKGREEFLKYISNEWKDVRLNKKDGKSYLYDDSYELDADKRIVNKWKLNAMQNPYEDGSTTPKVVFVDEISHYNQQELSMIEQWARQNQVIVLTAGDLNQDTFTCYTKLPGITEDVDVTISRNNFIRTPKQGVSLRTLNKQMTQAGRTVQSGLEALHNGESVDFNFNYHENDEEHPGLFGVKVLNPLNVDDISESELQQLLPTIKQMVDTLKTDDDGKKQKIGYIYSSSKPDSKLHKYLQDHYADSVEFFADSDAQGLEGQYYIVDLDRNKFKDNSYSDQDVMQYTRSLYTGITRAEQGALVIAPSSVGNIGTISSIEDPKYQLEELGENAIKKSSDEKRDQLSMILEDLMDGGITPNDIEFTAPTAFTRVPPPPLPGSGATLPPVLPPVAPAPILPAGIFANRADAEMELNHFNATLPGALDTLKAVKNGTSEELDITSITTVEIDDNFTNNVELSDGTTVSLQDFIKNYTVSTKDTEAVVPLYEKDRKIVVNIGGEEVNAYIDSIDTTDPKIVSYNLKKIEDNSDLGTMTQDVLQTAYLRDYVETIPEPEPEEPGPTGYENNPEEYEAVVADTNQDDPEEELIIDPTSSRLLNRLYTHATFETGVIRQSNGQIKYRGSAQTWNARIDSMIGLSKITGATDYDMLNSMLGQLKNDLNNDTKAEVAQSFNDAFYGGQGVTTVDFAFKSTSGENDRNDPFARYHLGNEELSYILSPDPEAKIAKRKKLVAVFKHDGSNVLEIPIGILNSPLTLMQREDPTVKGKKIFRGQVNGVETSVNDVFMQNFNTTHDTYKATQAVLTAFQGQNQLKDLMNLFKLYLYTSNGIFKLPDSFELSKQKSYGPELINRTKGTYQLDGHLWWDRNFEDLNQFAEHPQHNVSSIFISKEGKINGIRVPSLHPGHSFVLVSDDNKIKTDKQLVDQYIKQTIDSNEPKKVKLFYIVPPKAKVSSWLTNLHNVYRNKQGETLETWNIGNNFTSYNVLKNIIASGHWNDSEFQRPDELQSHIAQSIADLQEIEKKWKADTITFGDAEYNGKKEQQKYEEMLRTLNNEKMARNYMMLLEQTEYLRSPNKWGMASVSSDKTVEQGFNAYLTGLIWPRAIGHRTATIDPVKQQAILDKIDDVLKDSMPYVYYRAKYAPASEDVGPFSKVLVKSNSGKERYMMPSTVGSDVNAFAINDKIDTPTYTLDVSFNDVIEDIVNNIQFNPTYKVWQMMPNTSYKNWEDSYLHDRPVIVTPDQQIKSEYASKFADGTLDASVLNPNATRFQNLISLATAYTKAKPNQWGFVHNDKLILTQAVGTNNLRFKDDYQSAIGTTANDIILDLVNANNEVVPTTFWFDIDSAGYVTQVHCRCSNPKAIEIQNSSATGTTFTADQFDDFKTALTDPANHKGIGNPLKRFATVNTFEDIVNIAKAFGSTFEVSVQPRLFKILGIDDESQNPVMQALIEQLNGTLNSGSNTVAHNNIQVGTILRKGDNLYEVTAVDTATDSVQAVTLDKHYNQTPNIVNITDFTDFKKEEESCTTISWNRI